MMKKVNHTWLEVVTQYKRMCPYYLFEQQTGTAFKVCGLEDSTVN